VTPDNAYFNNSAYGYTLQGSAAIAGAAYLIKSGSATLTILNNNTYTNPTFINAGIVQVGNGGTSGALGSGAITDNGDLQFNRSDAVAVANSISGTGTLEQNGAGMLTLSGANSYTGATTVNAGILGLTGTLSGSSVTVANGAVFNESATGVITGSGVTFTHGSFGTSTLAGPNTFTGAITVVNGGELDLANWGGAILGTVNVTLGTLGISGSATYNLGANSFFVANGGFGGIVNQTGGTVTFTSGNALLVGNGAGTASVGTYNLSGGTLTNFASTTRGVMLGVNNGCWGTFNLSGAGNLALGTAELAVGRNDAASTDCTVAFNQTGGAATVGNLSVGGQSGSTNTIATFSLTGGTLAATNFQNLVAAASSSATMTLGGSAQVTLPAFPVPAGTANLTFDFTTGWLAPQAASAAYMRGLTTASLTTNGANFNVGSGKNITIGQSFADASGAAGTLRKTGVGTLTLTNASTYTGATVVSNGTLLVNGALSSPVTVIAGATLGGTGTIGNSVALSGTVSPGTSVGTLTTSNQTWNGGAAYRFELSSATNSAGRDLLNITGTLNVQASSGNKFAVKLVSMANTNTAGLVPDFNSNASYTWVVATASGSILNFDAGKFAIDASAFSNAYSGTFSVAVQGNSLAVNYAPPSRIVSFGPLSGTSFPLTFSGPSGQSYQVLTSTNVALPMTNWTVLSSGSFGASPVTYTDTGATNAHQFYRIKSP
jgi:autotransporter-associated beta strand protein